MIGMAVFEGRKDHDAWPVSSNFANDRDLERPMVLDFGIGQP